jgi:hypothetical protein
MRVPRRFGIAFAALALFLLLVLGVPLLLPDNLSIGSVTLSQNQLNPLTDNPSFESGYQSWGIARSGNTSIAVVVSSAYSGAHSLFMSSDMVDHGSAVVYSNNQTLPINLNSSTVFSLALKYVQQVSQAGDPSSLQTALTLSYLGKYTIPVFILIGNLTVPPNVTRTAMTTSGIVMTLSSSPGPNWRQFMLQLASPRMVTLYQQFLLQIFGLNVTSAQPTDFFLTGILLHPDNIICYIDDVGVYNALPAVAQLELNKLTPFPSTSLLAGIYLNSTQVSFSYNYGLLKDSFLLPVDYPLAQGMTLVFQTRSVLGATSQDTVTITSGPTAI